MSDSLGTLVWYSIGGPTDEPLPVSQEALAAWFDELALDAALLPPPTRGVEAFRAATSGLADEWESGGIRYKVSVREAKRTDDFVLRQLWASWVDADGNPQSRRVADLQFFRPRRVTAGRVHGTEKYKTMLHQGLEDLDRARLKAIVDRTRAAYEMHLNRLSTQVVRGLIRNYLLQQLRAVSMRSGSGGTYLVPTEHHETVRALRKLVARCGPQCRLMYTPMIDDPEQRDMIRDAVEADVEGRCESQLRDIDDWARKNEGKAPSMLLLGSWRAERGVLQELLLQHGDALGVTFDRAPDRLEDLGRAIDEMQLRAAAALRS